REEDDRHDLDETDQAEREPFLLGHEQRDVPQERGVLHRRPREREREAEPDQPEVPVTERNERGARDHECPRIRCGSYGCSSQVTSSVSSRTVSAPTSS